MRDYGVVKPTFWTGDTGIKLRRRGPMTQLVALYLISGPEANMIGIFNLPLPIVAFHTGLTIEQVQEALRALEEVGFARWDADSEMVFVMKMAAYQTGETLQPRDNRHVRVLKQLESLKKCPFVKDFIALYGEAYNLDHQRPSEGASQSHRSQDQDQDQEQEQEENQKSTPPPDPKPRKRDSRRSQKTAAADKVPESLDTPDFRAAWERWQQHRKEKRQPLTPSTIDAQLKKFSCIGKDRAIAMIEHTIEQGYVGLVDPEKRVAASKQDHTSPEEMANILRARHQTNGSGGQK